MQESSELANYLPLSYKTSTEQEYINFLWDAFEMNYTRASSMMHGGKSEASYGLLVHTLGTGRYNRVFSSYH
jgi:hypothetical protein